MCESIFLYCNMILFTAEIVVIIVLKFYQKSSLAPKLCSSINFDFKDQKHSIVLVLFGAFCLQTINLSRGFRAGFVIAKFGGHFEICNPNINKQNKVVLCLQTRYVFTYLYFPSAVAVID